MSLGINIKIIIMVIVLGTGCLHHPVDEEYYNDLSLVKGGQKPTPPVDLSLTVDGRRITVHFFTDKLDNGHLITFDPDAGTNKYLSYFFYISSQDPAGFNDPTLYYSEMYYIGMAAEQDFDDGDPKAVSITISSAYSGPVFIWMTSHDGGRESDHSGVVSVHIL